MNLVTMQALLPLMLLGLFFVALPAKCFRPAAAQWLAGIVVALVVGRYFWW